MPSFQNITLNSTSSKQGVDNVWRSNYLDGAYPPSGEVSALRLTFSDITSGPDTGLGDGLGSGSIVTVWGYGLGDDQGTSQIYFTDNLSQERVAAHVYYWKRADGNLPSKPANLFESHRLSEICFSIPASAVGLGNIHVNVNSVNSNSLPFTVRSGNIYFVDPSGDNTALGDWSNPKASINGDIRGPAFQLDALGNGNMIAGDIVYSKGVAEVATSGGGVEAGMFLRSIEGTESHPVAVIAYPNTHPTIVSANRGFQGYLSNSISLHGYTISVGHQDENEPANAGNPSQSDQHIQTSEFGRYAGNLLLQNDGTVFTGWSGAFVSSGAGINCSVLGNHIKDLGGPNSSRYQHTLYMSVRNEPSTAPASTIEFNYLDNNDVFNGIHIYDETYSGDLGDATGLLSIKYNVVKNQRGLGINISNRDLYGTVNTGWSCNMEIENNLLMNVGLGVPAEDGVATAGAVGIGGDFSSSYLTFKNNTIYKWGETSSRGLSGNDEALNVSFNLVTPTITIENNCFYSEYDSPWVSVPAYATQSNNAFFSPVAEAQASIPSWTNNVVTDPLLTQIGSLLVVEPNSPLINAGTTTDVEHDIIGRTRGTTIGAVEV